MPKAISHTVKRRGKSSGDGDVEISVAEDLVTVPGIPVREKDVSYYSRVYPLEAQFLEKSADREWEWSVWSDELTEFHKEHHERNRSFVHGSRSRLSQVLPSPWFSNRSSVGSEALPAVLVPFEKRSGGLQAAVPSQRLKGRRLRPGDQSYAWTLPRDLRSCPIRNSIHQQSFILKT